MRQPQRHTRTAINPLSAEPMLLFEATGLSAAPMTLCIEPICGADLLIMPLQPRCVHGRDPLPNRHWCLRS